MLIEVYSDGSATTGDKPGGYGYVICVNGIKVAEGSGYLHKATNNVAEITAAISGLEHVITHDISGVGGRTDANINSGCTEEDGARFVLISDSQLVLGYANGEYQCRKPHLLPLMLKLRKLYRQLGATTKWVKGHNGDEHNERCDVLAKAAREGGPTATGCQPQDRDDQVPKASNKAPR